MKPYIKLVIYRDTEGISGKNLKFDYIDKYMP